MSFPFSSSFYRVEIYYETYILAFALEKIKAFFEQLLPDQLGPLLQLLFDLACQLRLSFLQSFELPFDVADLLLILCACRYLLLRSLSAVVLLIAGRAVSIAKLVLQPPLLLLLV